MSSKVNKLLKRKKKNKRIDEEEEDDDETDDEVDSSGCSDTDVNENGNPSHALLKKSSRHGYGSDDGWDGDSFCDGEVGHRDQMRRMDQIFRDPFGTLGGGGGMLALPESSRLDRRRQQQQAQNMQVAERNLFMDPFAHFGSMFSNMRSMMSDMHRAFEQVPNDPNAQVYQQSSFMSYASSGNGAPRVYQASSSSVKGPGGVKETRRTVRDSESGVEKMAVGHHINDRAHIIERSRNMKTGEKNENQDYINLDEEDAVPFDQEYQEKWRSNMTMRGIDQRRRVERSRHAPAPVGEAPHHRSRYAALPEPERRHRKSSNRKE